MNRCPNCKGELINDLCTMCQTSFTSTTVSDKTTLDPCIVKGCVPTNKVICKVCGRTIADSSEQYCFFCQKVTETIDGDCAICKLSKTTPLDQIAYEQAKEIERLKAIITEEYSSFEEPYQDQRCGPANGVR